MKYVLFEFDKRKLFTIINQVGCFTNLIWKGIE